MKMFDYLRPETIEEAHALRHRYGKRAVFIAGGTDIIPMIKKKVAFPDVLISLKSISGLDQIVHDGVLRIGATATHRSIEKSALIRDHYSALADAEDVLGSVQIRNVGTIGGNICTAAPSADTAPPLLVLGAQARVTSLKGERTIPLEGFFKGPGETVMDDMEMLTEFEIPDPFPYTASAYWKHQQRLALDLPILGVAVLLSLDKNRIACSDLLGSNAPIACIFQSLEQDVLVCREVRIALSVAAPTPMRAFKAESLLRGRSISSELLEEVANTASEESQPRDSVRGEAWYRREMIKVFAQRMILQCIIRIVRAGESGVALQ